MMHLEYIVWKLRSKFIREHKIFHVNNTLNINPKKIVYCSLKKFNLFNDTGKVIKGNWDKLEKKFENLDEFKSLEKSLKKNKNWEKNVIYSAHNNQTIYKDEVSINIGRNGDLLFNDGVYKLSQAKLLKFPTIPVRIVVRHPKWVKFKKELLAACQETDGKIYHPVNHPDFLNIPVLYDDYRFHLIKDNLSVKKGKLLDIGAHLGYFCHRFEDEGFDCYAVEYNLKCVYLLRKLRKAENKKYKIIPQSIFKFKRGENLEFDVVLALNIFHHFLKTKKSYEMLITLLERLKMEELYLQTHNPHESQMEGAYKNYEPIEFVDFILQHSCLTESKLIGITPNDRHIYKLYKHHARDIKNY
ncbi:MAG: class I SAM-dependent methyltransferase [Candidatus Hodarchaeota archaeon]